MPDSLLRRAAILAGEEGVSLDQFVATALAEKLAVLDADNRRWSSAPREDAEKVGS